MVFGDSTASLQPILDRIQERARSIGLEINSSKTKYLLSSVSDCSSTLRLGSEVLEKVNSFKYLGSEILPSGQAKDEIRLRVDKARHAFMQLYGSLWKRTEISMKTKLRVFKACIRPILVYGCETWPLRVEDARKLESFDNWCLCVIA